MWNSVQTRLTITFIGLAIGPLLLMGVALVWQSYTIQQQQALTLQSEVAHRVSIQVAGFIQELEDELQAIIRVQSLKTLDREQQTDVLERLQAYNDVFAELTLLDGQGQEQIRLSWIEFVTPADLTERSKEPEFIVPKSSGQTYFSPVRFDEETGEPLMTIAVPLFDVRSGLVDGILVATVRFKKVWDLIAGIPVSEGGGIYILDAEGRVVAHRNPSVVLRNTTVDPPSQTGLQTGLSGTQVVLGVDRVQFGEQTFIIVAERPLAEALALAINTVLITLAVMVVTLATAVGLGVVAVRHLVRPIQALVSAAQAIRAGDLSQQVEASGLNELDDLAETFNSMTIQLRQTLTDLERQLAKLAETNITLQEQITERQEAEAALRRSEQLLAAYSQTLEQTIEQRTAELAQATRQAEEARLSAEAANRAKSVFLANMSHELRTPLNAILGLTQLMNRNRSLTLEQREHLEIIGRSGEHLLGLINDVLEVSKIEAGQIKLNETDFDLYHLLDDLEDMFHLRAVDKNLQLIFDRASDVPQYVRTDESKLRQVLINLLGNAIKFTQEGGVSLRVTMVNGQASTAHDPGLRTDGQGQRTFHFEVEDTGPGIAPDELGTLFEAFGQTKSGRQIQEGTGLGLIISQQFVRLMDGEITVSSQVGHGCIFKFDIHLGLADPVDIRPRPSARRVIGLAPDQPSYRVLVVDDKRDSRILLVKLLALLNFEIREAENGQEALEIWEQWEPHLILMDMRMPVMNGYEATQQIKATVKGQATVIIALTASAFDEAQAAVRWSGCDDFIRKPFREADLFDKIAQHLGVRYVYDQDQAVESKAELEAGYPKGLIPVALAKLPAEVLTALHQATVQGDFDQILILIEQIRAQDQPLAAILADLAHKFDFVQILQLIKPAEEQK